MLTIENVSVVGLDDAVRGMRNPLNSWAKSDTIGDTLGSADKKLAINLAKAGPSHGKYRRMIVVYLDITAPLYWWKEFDTYKVGTVADSCSTMHTIHTKDFTLEDFSCEHLESADLTTLMGIIERLNINRKWFVKTKDKQYWWQMIQLLPTSFNQRRTVMVNYEVLANIYNTRQNHTLDEWHVVCDWIKTLPNAELITLEE